MVTETVSEIESIDIANEDLIATLARLASGESETMVLAGDGPRRMAVPASGSNVVIDRTFDAEALVEDGQVVESVTIDGEEVELNVA